MGCRTEFVMVYCRGGGGSTWVGGCWKRRDLVLEVTTDPPLNSLVRYVRLLEVQYYCDLESSAVMDKVMRLGMENVLSEIK